MKKIKTIINPRFNEILGTDRFFDCNKTFGREYKKYRKRWNEYPKNEILGEFPLHIDIESTNNCNLRCIMCSRKFMEEEIGYISWELFKKIVDEGSRYNLPSIKLNYRGEPLMHPKLTDMVKYAKDKGIIEVQFNTNGLLLDATKANELLDAGLDRIIFSFDGATKETYERIRAGSDYDGVINNIKRVVELRDDRGMKRPCVRVQMVEMEENKNEVEDFIDMWKPIVNRVAINQLRNPEGAIGKYKSVFPCPEIWQRLMVCWNGEVRMCCGDWAGEYPIGNAKKSSLYELWHSEKYNRVREAHKREKFDEIPVCAKCEVNKVW